MTVLRDAPESQFAYVVVVARRARQLLIGARPFVAGLEFVRRRLRDIRHAGIDRHSIGFFGNRAVSAIGILWSD